MRGITNAGGSVLKTGQITFDNKSGSNGYVPTSTFDNISLSTDTSFEDVYPKGFICNIFTYLSDMPIAASAIRNYIISQNGNTAIISFNHNQAVTWIYEITNDTVVLKTTVSYSLPSDSVYGSMACAFKGKYYFINSGNNIVYSSNLTNWSVLSTSFNSSVYMILASDDVMIAVTANAIYSTTDGISWTSRITGSYGSNTRGNFDHNNGFFVFNTANYNRITCSNDGLNWNHYNFNYSDVIYGSPIDVIGSYDKYGNIILFVSESGGGCSMIKINPSNSQNTLIAKLGSGGEYTAGAVINFGNGILHVNEGGYVMQYNGDNIVGSSSHATMKAISNISILSNMQLAGSCLDRINNKIYFGTYGNYQGVFIGDYGYVMPTFLEQAYVKK